MTAPVSDSVAEASPERQAAARIARQRLSTVYYPGNKITMLPPSVVQQYSLGKFPAGCSYCYPTCPRDSR